MAFMEVLAFGTPEMLTRPCVDCGKITGSFCDYCRAADRMPTQTWAQNQATPLCMTCDRKYDKCRFCRADHAQTQANPATHGPGHDDGTRSRPVFGPEPPPGLIEELRAAEHRADPLRRWQLINALNLTPAACSTAPAPQTPEGDTPAASSTAPAPVRLIEEPLSERLKAIMNRGVRENLSAGS